MGAFLGFIFLIWLIIKVIDSLFVEIILGVAVYCFSYFITQFFSSQPGDWAGGVTFLVLLVFILIIKPKNEKREKKERDARVALQQKEENDRKEKEKTLYTPFRSKSYYEEIAEHDYLIEKEYEASSRMYRDF
jgi:putative Ca2+/H+ antiporter (TMEM165/GDT1 family)